MAHATARAIDAVPPAEVEDVELYHAHSWWTKYVFCQDAKVIAIQYSVTALAIGLVALVLSWLMRLQLGFPDTFSIIDATQYYQFITMHGMIMVIYLLTALFLGGFGNYLIPLMVGARDMVFPYVNMLSYWIYLLAVLVLVAGFFVPGGPTGAGWTLYPPQAILSGTPGRDWGIIMMLLSLILFIIGFTMGGLNYVVTVLQGRTRGMTLMRLPLTVWGIFTATVLALLAFPALFVACVMMLLDRVLGTSFFMPTIVEMGEQLSYGGGSPILFQHLFWFFGHPEVYIVALPAFGIVSDLIATHARKNIFGYRMMVWAIVAIGGLSFVVWAHHMYVSGMDPYFGFFFATTTLIIAVPTAIKVYNWVLTLWRGDIHLTVPMLFALGFIVTFVNGGLTGLFLGNVVVDVPLSDTMFVVAHFHMVMGVAPIMVIFGAIYHWYPKITGRMLDDTLGKFHFWVTFLGAYADLLPDPLSRPDGRAAPLLRAGRDGVHPGVGPHAQRLRHRRGPDRRLRPDGIPVQPDLEPAPGSAGRRQSVARHDPGVADAGDPAGARQLGQGAAGGLSLGLRLQRAGRAGGLHPAERAAGRAARLGARPWPSPQHSWPWSRDRHLVAVAPETGGQAVAGRGRDRRPSGRGRAARADGQDRPRRVSRRRRLAVRAVLQRLPDAHAHGRGLAPDAGAAAAVAQHGVLIASCPRYLLPNCRPPLRWGTPCATATSTAST